MAEYINREIAINLIKDYMTPAINGYEEFLRDEICGNILGKLSTVDVVEVVRCKDCALHGTNDCYWDEYAKNGPDDFCSRGKKKIQQ